MRLPTKNTVLTILIASLLFPSNILGLKSKCPQDCRTCHKDNVCIQCFAGFFKKSDEECLKCGEGCSSCKDSSHNCLSCHNGYRHDSKANSCIEKSFTARNLIIILVVVLICFTVIFGTLIFIRYKKKKKKMDERKWILESEKGSFRDSMRNSFLGGVSVGDYSVFGMKYSKKKKKEWRLDDDKNEWRNDLEEDDIEEGYYPKKKRTGSKSFVHDPANGLFIDTEESRDRVSNFHTEKNGKKKKLKKQRTDVDKEQKESTTTPKSVGTSGFTVGTVYGSVQSSSERQISKETDVEGPVPPRRETEYSDFQTCLGSNEDDQSYLSGSLLNK